jgi:hypothetical protein
MMFKKELSFWVLLTMLNCLLFLPGFLLTSFNDVIIVNQGEVDNSFPFFEKLFYRFNYDFFRGGVEFTLLSIFFLYFKYKISKRKGRQVLFVTYICSAVYLFYFQVSCLVYQTTPLFFNDISVIIDTTILFAESDFNRFMWGIASFGVLVILVFYIIRSFWSILYQVLPQRMSFVMSFIIILFSIVNMKFGVKWTAQNTFIPVSLDLVNNVYETLSSFKYVRSVNPGEVNAGQAKVSARFNSKKPNIHLVVIESYGEILNTNDIFRDPYNDSILSCEYLLEKNGWSAVSTLSQAPLNGMNSKVSYGSVMYGFDFQNSGIYSYFYNTRKLLNTNHWGNHLRRIGYRNYLLDAVKYPVHHNTQWNQEKSFYAFDSIISTNDFSYNGKLVSYGPAVLGQYAFGFALDKVSKNIKTPVFTFFFSHMLNSSFDEVRVFNRWADSQVFFVDGKKGKRLKVKLTKEEYLKTELYQLGFLTQNILEMGDDDDVFILIGDHQPFFYTTFEDSRRTPVHIITKNKKLLSLLKNEGFEVGLVTKNVSNGTEHSLIYKKFMNAFYKL